MDTHRKANSSGPYRCLLTKNIGLSTGSKLITALTDHIQNYRILNREQTHQGLIAVSLQILLLIGKQTHQGIISAHLQNYWFYTRSNYHDIITQHRANFSGLHHCSLTNVTGYSTKGCLIIARLQKYWMLKGEHAYTIIEYTTESKYQGLIASRLQKLDTQGRANSSWPHCCPLKTKLYTQRRANQGLVAFCSAVTGYSTKRSLQGISAARLQNYFMHNEEQTSRSQRCPLSQLLDIEKKKKKKKKQQQKSKLISVFSLSTLTVIRYSAENKFIRVSSVIAYTTEHKIIKASALPAYAIIGYTMRNKHQCLVVSRLLNHWMHNDEPTTGSLIAARLLSYRTLSGQTH